MPDLDALHAHAERSGLLERCPPDPDGARATLDCGTDRPAYVEFALSRGDWQSALTFAHGAARRAVLMLLLHEGWRPTDEADLDVVAQEVASVWLADADPGRQRLADSYRRACKVVRAFEWPTPETQTSDDDELRELVEDCLALVDMVREQLRLSTSG